MSTNDVIMMCVTIFVVVLCGGAFLYDRYRKENWWLMQRNEMVYCTNEGIPFGSDDRVTVREEITL